MMTPIKRAGHRNDETVRCKDALIFQLMVPVVSVEDALLVPDRTTYSATVLSMKAEMYGMNGILWLIVAIYWVARGDQMDRSQKHLRLKISAMC
jgi:hypothetical protein